MPGSAITGMAIMVAPIMITMALTAHTMSITPVSDRTMITTVLITGGYTVMAITAMVFTITAGSTIILPGAVLEDEAAWADFMVDSTVAEALPTAEEATEEEVTADSPIAVCLGKKIQLLGFPLMRNDSRGRRTVGPELL